jgi:putative transposase
MDRYLDEARVGPTWLKREEIAAVVQESIHYAADQLSYCSLHAYVIMANHVHVLVTPLVSPSKLLQSVKGYSAREANKLLDRTGETFWQTESYDHWIRDETEFERVRRYIENNPPGWTGVQARRLPLVQRKRRQESRRGRLKARST